MARKKYKEGEHTYEKDDNGQIYKNGKLVDKKNYKYIPTAIGGTRVDKPSSLTGTKGNTNTGSNNSTNPYSGGITFEELAAKAAQGTLSEDGRTRTYINPENIALQKTIDKALANGRTSLEQYELPQSYKTQNIGNLGNTGAFSLENLAAQMANIKPIASYDPTKDAAYQSALQQYKKAGEVSFNDNLAQLAARSGGNISSYAANAASQARNSMIQQGQNMMPEFANAYYQRANANRSAELNRLSALAGLNNSFYNRQMDQTKLDMQNQQYEDNLLKWQAEQALKQQQWQAQQQQYQDQQDWKQKEFEYGVSRDQSKDYQWQQEYNSLDTYRQGQLDIKNQSENTPSNDGATMAGFMLNSEDPKQWLLDRASKGMITDAQFTMLYKMLPDNEQTALLEMLNQQGSNNSN